MKAANQSAGFAKESDWGTYVQPDTTLLLTGAGLVSDDENQIEPVNANASFPVPHSLELMKRMCRFNVRSLVYPAQAAALLAIGNDRTEAGDLESYSFVKNEGFSGVGRRWVGAKCGSQVLSWSHDGFVELSQDFIAKAVSKNVFTPGSYVTGSPLKGSQVVVSINSVTASKVFSGEVNWANNLEEGPVDPNYVIQFLEAGFLALTGSIQAQFASDDWNALQRDPSNGSLTEFDIQILLKDVTGSTILTIDIGDCQASAVPLEAGEQGETVKQSIRWVSRTVPTLTGA